MGKRDVVRVQTGDELPPGCPKTLVESAAHTCETQDRRLGGGSAQEKEENEIVGLMDILLAPNHHRETVVISYTVGAYGYLNACIYGTYTYTLTHNLNALRRGVKSQAPSTAATQLHSRACIMRIDHAHTSCTYIMHIHHAHTSCIDRSMHPAASTCLSVNIPPNRPVEEGSSMSVTPRALEASLSFNEHRRY